MSEYSYINWLLDNEIDPGTYEWTAQPIETLTFGEGLHFALWMGDASLESADFDTVNKSFISGPVYFTGSVAIATSATSASAVGGSETLSKGIDSSVVSLVCICGFVFR